MAVVGACWGDEGKGKIADFFAERADYVVRWQGGANAGHTLVNRWGKTVLHLLPSGVFHEHTVNVLGPATALDPWQLLSELDTLKRRGVRPRVALSDRAQIVLPVHRLLDELEEERLGQAAFGSTRRGIAPFYADRALKINIRLADLFDGPRLPERIARNLTAKNVLLEHLYRHPPVDAEALARAARAAAAPAQATGHGRRGDAAQRLRTGKDNTAGGTAWRAARSGSRHLSVRNVLLAAGRWEYGRAGPSAPEPGRRDRGS